MTDNQQIKRPGNPWTEHVKMIPLNLMVTPAQKAWLVAEKTRTGQPMAGILRGLIEGGMGDGE